MNRNEFDELVYRTLRDIQDGKTTDTKVAVGHLTPELTVAYDAIRDAAKQLQGDGSTSDGYHTFDELYEYRKMYNAMLFNLWDVLALHRGSFGDGFNVHKAKRHSDGELCFGGGRFVFIACVKRTPNGFFRNLMAGYFVA